MYAEPDIEDYGKLLHQFRSRRGLSVTDVSKTEWCDKQMEFSLSFKEFKNDETKPGEEWCSQRKIDLDISFRGGRRKNEAIKAGIDRHVQLQREVLSPVKVKSLEEVMAAKLVNFINGVNRLRTDGLTRELPIVSFDFAQGIWCSLITSISIHVQFITLKMSNKSKVTMCGHSI